MLTYTFMLRTTVYLEKEIALALRRLADATKRPQAEIIRDALRKYMSRYQRGAAIPGVGAYRSGRSDVSRKAEQLLRKAVRVRR